MELYSQILDHAGPAFGIILRHIRDRPDDPCLFHCTGRLAPAYGFRLATLTSHASPQPAKIERAC